MCKFLSQKNHAISLFLALKKHYLYMYILTLLTLFILGMSPQEQQKIIRRIGHPVDLDCLRVTRILLFDYFTANIYCIH